MKIDIKKRNALSLKIQNLIEHSQNFTSLYYYSELHDMQRKNSVPKLWKICTFKRTTTIWHSAHLSSLAKFNSFNLSSSRVLI